MDESRLRSRMVRLTAAVIAGSIALCIATGCILAYILGAAHDADHAQLLVEVDEYKSRILKQLDKNLEILSMLSGTLETTGSKEDIAACLENGIDKISDSGPFVSLAYFSDSGEGIICAPGVGVREMLLGECSPEAREAVMSAMMGESSVSRLFDSRIYDEKVFVYSVPVYSEGRVVGVLAGGDSLELFEDLVNGDTVMGGKGYIHLLGQDGSFIVRSKNTLVKENPATIFDGPYLSDNTKVNAYYALASGEGMYGDFSYRGKLCHFYMEPVGINGWQLFCVNLLWGSSMSFGRVLVIVGIVLFAALIIMLAILYTSYHRFRKYTQELLKLAYRDPVTGCNNIFKFDKQFKELTAVSKNYTVAALNIHNFKGVNDLFGRARGDGILTIIKGAIEDGLLPDEFFCRDSADIFYILFRETDEGVVRERIRSITRNAAQSSMEYGSYRYEISFYSGAAVCGSCEQALVAMQSIKRVHYTDIAFYNDRLREDVVKRSRIEGRMQTALAGREFKLFLQPKFELKTGRLTGAEALVRWQNQDGSYIYPNEFIPLFEENGFCMKLDMYMVERVCELIRSWLDAGIEPIPISVNQTKLLFRDQGYPNSLEQLLLSYNVPPRLVILELLEDIAAENLKQIDSQIKTLHAKGFRVSMDDFGSGYSSLNMLYHLEVDEIKLDRGFMSKTGGEDDSRKKVILEHVILLAKELGIATIAEGIETREDVEDMLRLSCDCGQGYYYEAPMEWREFCKKYISGHKPAKDRADGSVTTRQP